MVKKNDGRISNKQKKEKLYGGRVIKCKSCKTEYDLTLIEDDIYKVGGKTFISCDCGEQIKLK